MPELETRTGRDTRLLALVIVIAVGVLFGLARFRYPATEIAPAPPTPLARLAASGTYDDLASAVRAALQSASPALLTISLEPESPSGESPKPGDQSSKPPDEALASGAQKVSRNGIAVRLTAETATILLPAGTGVSGASSVYKLRWFDPQRRIAFLSTPASAGAILTVRTAADFGGFTYVVIVEAAMGGPTASPVFIGRVDPILDDRWDGTVLAARDVAGLSAGALVFLLDGRFVGLIADSAGGSRVLVPASHLETLAAGPPGESR